MKQPVLLNKNRLFFLIFFDFTVENTNFVASNFNTNMIYSKKNIITLCALLLFLSVVKAQEENDWIDKIKLMTYSPRYFGPNAFPMPELRSGRINKKWEIEIRGENHFYPGDCTKDIFGRLFIPIADGRAGFEVSGVAWEYYNMKPATVEERHAAGRYWEQGVRGDFVFNSFYQLPKWEKVDIMSEIALKTASGKRLADARYTDAASYWLHINAGRDIFQSADSSLTVRLHGLLGFYCWMTNNLVHRQNDAPLYSFGIYAKRYNWSIQADIAGFHGYRHDGDCPMIFRSKLNYEFKEFMFSLGYRYGLNDYFYHTISLAVTKRFSL